MEDNNTNQASGTDTDTKKKGGDKRKQSLYLPDDMLQALQEEAARIDRSLSWVVQRCIKVGMSSIKSLPSVDDADGE